MTSNYNDFDRRATVPGALPAPEDSGGRFATDPRAVHEALLLEAQRMQRANYNGGMPGVARPDAYNQFGETRGLVRAGDAPSTVYQREIATRHYIVQPPPQFKDLLEYDYRRPIPIRPDPGRPPYGEVKPPKPGPQRPDATTPGRDKPNGQPDARPDAGNDNTWKWILAGAGAYGAYRLLRQYMNRDDAVNRLSDRMTIKMDPGRDEKASEILLKERKTGERIDPKTFDGKTFSSADGKRRVNPSEIDVEAHIAQRNVPPAEQRKYIEEQRARLRGQLDLQLRGRENLSPLLDGVTVQAEAKAPAGSRRFVLQSEGREMEVRGATSDGKLKVVGAQGQIETHELKPGDKVTLRVGGENGAALVSQKDALTSLSKLLGQQSDIQISKRISDFGQRTTGNELASKLEQGAAQLNGDRAQGMQDAIKAVKERGSGSLDVLDKMQISEALREKANKLNQDHQKEYAAGLRQAADAIMPPDVVADVKRLQVQATQQLANDAKQKQFEQEEAKRKQEADPEAKRKQEQADAEAKRKQEADAEAKRKQEQADAEAKRKQEADAEAKRKQEQADAEAKRKQEQADAEAKRKQEADAEAKRKQEQADAEAKRKQEADAEAKRKQEADAEAKRKEQERKEPAGEAGGEAERKHRRRNPDELERPEADVRPDGSVAGNREEIGSLAKLAERKSLEKRHVDGMEAYLAKLKEEQAKAADPARQQQIDRLGETIAILRGERGVEAQREANRGIIEAVGKEVERRRGSGAAGMAVSAEILASMALIWYASTLQKTEDPLERARLGS
jgi:hypothetical protein